MPDLTPTHRRRRRTGVAVVVAACSFAATPGASWAAPSGKAPSQVDIDLDLCGTTLGVIGETLESCTPVVPEEEPTLPQDPLDLLDLVDGVLGGDLPADGPIADVALAGVPVATVNQPGQETLVDVPLLRDSDEVDDVADVEVGSQPSDARLLDGRLLRGALAQGTVSGGAESPANANVTVNLCGTSVGVLGSASATCPAAGSGSGNAFATCDAPTGLLGCGSPLAFGSDSSLCGVGVAVGATYGTSCLADVPEGAGRSGTDPTGGSPPATIPSSAAPGGGDGAGSAGVGGEGGTGNIGGSPSAAGAGVGAGVPAQVGDLPVTGAGIGLMIVFAASLVISGLVAWRFRGVRIE